MFPILSYCSYDTHCQLACIMSKVLCFYVEKFLQSERRNGSTSSEPCPGAYLCGHLWNGQWWSAPWCHLRVPWAMWPAPPFPPRPPGSDREAWSHSQPGSAAMWWAPTAPQRHPGNMTLQKERWTDLFLYLVLWLAWNMLLKLQVIVIPVYKSLFGF